MTAATFTPGPWEWARGCVYRDPTADCWSLYAGEQRVHTDGSACGEYGPDIDPEGPDARLIATAPELLQELQQLLGMRLITVFGNGVHSLEAKRAEADTDPFVIRARAAIAKATGETV